MLMIALTFALHSQRLSIPSKGYERLAIPTDGASLVGGDTAALNYGLCILGVICLVLLPLLRFCPYALSDT